LNCPVEQGASAPSPSHHDLQQPLNVIRLAAGNVRNRILPLLSREHASYLEEKLERIERQVDRAAELVNAVPATRAS
jgi:signal transduction histidine kinase